jgi:drug/metabolite transporter (DMT)-like permease
MLLSIVLWRQRNDFKTEILPWHLLRAVAGSSSFLLFMTAVKSIDLVNATVLLITMPILIPLIAWVVMHQHIQRGLWFAIAIGFAGLLVVVRPSTTTINAFTKATAQNLAKRKIRVNAVAPGSVWTPGIPSTMTPEQVDNFDQDNAMKRAGQPEELAPTYVYFASESRIDSFPHR